MVKYIKYCKCCCDFNVMNIMFIVCDHDKQTLKNNFNNFFLKKIQNPNGHNLNFKKTTVMLMISIRWVYGYNLIMFTMFLCSSKILNEKQQQKHMLDLLFTMCNGHNLNFQKF